MNANTTVIITVVSAAKANVGLEPLTRGREQITSTKYKICYS